LRGLPDPGDGALAVGEAPDLLQIAEGRGTGKAVPDLDQAAGGPVLGGVGEFLLGSEVVSPSTGQTASNSTDKQLSESM